MTQFPEPMRPFIIHVKDVQEDANCGFRAVADMLDFGEDIWAQIRCDMLQEINAYTHIYLGVYGTAEHVEEIRQSLIHLEGGAPYAKWMIMPDIRYLIASHYNVVLILLSLHQYLTFLLLRTELVPQIAHRSISVEFVNNNNFMGLVTYSVILYFFEFNIKMAYMSSFFICRYI